jgi:glycosyltransferase involved in cell wall biosynthesis
MAEGHTVMVAASAGGELWKILPEQVLIWPIKSLKRAISPLDDFKTYLEIRRIYKVYQPDVIHLHSSKIGFLGRLAFPKHRTLYTVHGFDSVRIAFRRFLFVEKALQFRVAHIVGVSQYDFKNLIAEGITNSVSYIYNGIFDHYSETRHSHPNDPVPQTLDARNKKSFSVLCIARLSPQKRFGLFCEVARLLANHDIDFYWIGNKETPENLPENVHCLGEIPNAYRLMASAHLFFLPTDYEGMPISILEALCYGIPVVASDVGGIKEVLNGKNGVALENNAKTFAAQILHYKENPELYQQAQLQARNSYLEHFTVEKMYNSYKYLYQSMIKSGS